MTSYQYRRFHCGDKMILRPSYLHNGISYTGKISVYSIRAQHLITLLVLRMPYSRRTRTVSWLLMPWLLVSSVHQQLSQIAKLMWPTWGLPGFCRPPVGPASPWTLLSEMFYGLCRINRCLSSTVKPVYNDHLMGYFSAFWSSSRWPRAT